jgi:NAD(P)-dependent dehydrogenase (short-subunit alcohol dehydrogenase family)
MSARLAARLQHSTHVKILSRRFLHSVEAKGNAAVAMQTMTHQSERCHLSETSRSFSTYNPPPNNVYHGEPVYDNIDLAAAHDDMVSQRRNEDSDAVFVVSGASRGMGLQFTKDLLRRTSGTIVACCRKPDQAEELARVADGSSGRVLVLPLDVTDQTSIANMAKEIETTYHGRVDALYNIAGILGDSAGSGPERNIAAMDKSWFKQNLAINTIGPMMVTQALAPMMQAKRGKKYVNSKTAESIVVNMSARVGSIADNQGGLGWHSYRISKAALNMGTRILGHELKRQGVWTVALYPGFTDTDLSKPFQKGVKPDKIFPVDFTVGRMIDVVDSMEAKHSGGLFDWAGQALPF